MIKKIIILSFLSLALISPCWAADLVEGTNAGFVTVAPTADPETGSNTFDTYSSAVKFTSPAGTNTVTQMGWYCGNATQEANFEMGIYSHDSGNDRPDILLASNKINAKGTAEGWKTSSVSYALTPSTIYWLAVQLDDTATTTIFDNTSNASYKRDARSNETELPDPDWGSSTFTDGRLFAVYALYTTPVTAKPQLILITE